MKTKLLLLFFAASILILPITDKRSFEGSCDYANCAWGTPSDTIGFIHIFGENGLFANYQVMIAEGVVEIILIEDL